MILSFYKPEKTVSGPAYSAAFKAFATLISTALALYGIDIATRFPLLQFGIGVKLV